MSGIFMTLLVGSVLVGLATSISVPESSIEKMLDQLHNYQLQTFETAYLMSKIIKTIEEQGNPPEWAEQKKQISWWLNIHQLKHVDCGGADIRKIMNSNLTEYSQNIVALLDEGRVTIERACILRARTLVSIAINRLDTNLKTNIDSLMSHIGVLDGVFLLPTVLGGGCFSYLSSKVELRDMKFAPHEYDSRWAYANEFYVHVVSMCNHFTWIFKKTESNVAEWLPAEDESERLWLLKRDICKAIIADHDNLIDESYNAFIDWMKVFRN